MKKLMRLAFAPAFFLSISSYAEFTPVLVAENTLKINAFGEEVFYYGFAEGDQVIFDFEEMKGKELKEVEIMEMPSFSKFMDYKTQKIENKILTITRTGIYKFRFTNTGLGGRICKFKIQRIPGSEATKNFNCAVYWRTVYDTSFVPTQESFLVKSDTAVVNTVDQIPKVSSQTALNGNPNYTIVDFDLPPGTIRWSYYIGVGNEGKTAYDQATSQFLNSAAASVSKIPGYGTMAALALSGLNYFAKTQGNDNVKYYFIKDWNNVLLFRNRQQFLLYKQGDVVNDAYQMTSPLNGKIFLALENDNIREAIEVTVKVTAITVTNQWDTRTVNKMNISKREESYLKN